MRPRLSTINLVLLASGASAASATTFTPTGAVAWKASTTNPLKLWVGLNSTPWTCLPGATAGTGSVANSGGTAYITGLALPAGSLSCTYLGTTIQTTINMIFTTPGQGSVNSGGYSVMPRLDINATASAPWSGGLTAQPIPGLPFPAQFTNGTTGINGANPSKLTVTEMRAVGRVYDTMFGFGSTWIYLSGTFNIGTTTAPVTVS